jgi:broad specificity phosphatase PhoE
MVLVRHAESVGNVANREAHDRGAGHLALGERDADVPLTGTGVRQARAIGAFLAEMPRREWPTDVLSSPYRRAECTAREALDVAGLDLPVRTDERLRERDLGVFDGLTGVGIREEHPEEAERRRRLGKFYYRPPCGESWCDVALRVRQLLMELMHREDGPRIWVFTHQAVILSFRVAIEALREHEVLAIDAGPPLANGSLTVYVRDRGGRLVLRSFGDTSAVERAAPLTRQPVDEGRSGDVLA